MEISKLATILSLLFVASAVILSPSAAESVAAEREFDYFALALQWPGAYCARTRHCCPKNGCCRSLPLTEFTIHGLWPNYNDGSWPSCCTGSDFDAKKISSLSPLLEKYWPSLSCSSPSLCHGRKGPFWAHEWEKHGTCSYPVIKDEYSYFSTVLDLYSKYNITRVLNNAGFFATNAERYPLGDIVSTIEKSVGASPLLVCRRGSVEELQLCFDKDLKPRDCRIASNSADDAHAPNLRSSCPKYIILPTYAPLVSVPEVVDASNTWGAKASILFSKIMESWEGIAAE